MCVRVGGLSSVEKVIESKKIGTIELSTGIQISSVFTRVISNDDKPIYIQSSSPTALSNNNKELIGHGTDYHKDGFGSPLGKLEGINLAIEDMSPKDLKAYGIIEGEYVELKFEGGILVRGIIITGKRDIKGKIQLISFKDCSVKYKDEILFEPDWGIYDMAVGKDVVSVFAGPADDDSFLDNYKLPTSTSEQIVYDDKSLHLHKLYAEVKKIRQSGGNIELQKISGIYNQIISNYHDEWLILLEIYEVLYETKYELRDSVKKSLLDLKKNNKFTDLIENGLKLIE
tara:strand:- start:109 stop:966 length:858 start_codon:yes stop_codon:yes gene_type:complete